MSKVLPPHYLGGHTTVALNRGAKVYNVAGDDHASKSKVARDLTACVDGADDLGGGEGRKDGEAEGQVSGVEGEHVEDAVLFKRVWGSRLYLVNGMGGRER